MVGRLKSLNNENIIRFGVLLLRFEFCLQIYYDDIPKIADIWPL